MGLGVFLPECSVGSCDELKIQVVDKEGKIMPSSIEGDDDDEYGKESKIPRIRMPINARVEIKTPDGTIYSKRKDMPRDYLLAMPGNRVVTSNIIPLYSFIFL